MSTDIKKIIKDHSKQINIAAKEAFEYFSKQNAIIEPFPGCTTYISFKDCKNMYADLLQDLIMNKIPFVDRYNMFVMARPVGKDNNDNIQFQIRFGLIF